MVETTEQMLAKTFKTGTSVINKYGWKIPENPLLEWEDEETKFQRSKELKEIGSQLIDTFRPDLKENEVNIGWVFQQKAGKSASGTILGKAKKQGDLDRVLSGYDAVIIIGFDTWLGLDLDGKFRLIHHELEHIYYDSEKEKVALRDHTIQEFAETIAIFGVENSQQFEFILAQKRFEEQNL